MAALEHSSFDFHTVSADQKVWLMHAETHRLFRVNDVEIASDQDDETGCHPVQIDLEKIATDLDLLDEYDILRRVNRECLESASPLDGANLALNINLTSVCNLGCTYCFAEGGDYGRLKGKLNTDTDLDDIIRFIRANASPGETVRLEFFGGEPMINFDAIEKLCWLSRDVVKEDDINFQYRISTNLTTKVSERELKLFDEFGFTVSVSVDGGQETHDRNRPNKAGRGSFDAIMQNVRKIREGAERATLVARMTYVPLPDSALMDDVYELHGLNLFDWFQILPAVVGDEFLKPVFGETFADWSRSEIDDYCADKIDAEFSKLSDAYGSLFSPDNRFRGVLEIETIIRMLLLGEVSNGHCSGGRKYFTFSPDKSIMPCHRLVGDDQFQAGDFASGKAERAVEVWRTSINDNPYCSKCAIRYICGGGCKQENFVQTGKLEKPDPKSCRFQFRLVNSAIQAIGNFDEETRAKDRSALRDLFVSCGRPTIKTPRKSISKAEMPDLQHLEPII